jgi:hypothetical protein
MFLALPVHRVLTDSPRPLDEGITVENLFQGKKKTSLEVDPFFGWE